MITEHDEQMGIIEGPVWNNFDVCPPESFVCSFECESRKYDLYIVDQGMHGQSFVLRHADDWDGAYGSAPLETLFNAQSEPMAQALWILRNKGHFSWKKD